MKVEISDRVSVIGRIILSPGGLQGGTATVVGPSMQVGRGLGNRTPGNDLELRGKPARQSWRTESGRGGQATPIS
jgi:hypothetical protein